MGSELIALAVGGVVMFLIGIVIGLALRKRGWR